MLIFKSNQPSEEDIASIYNAAATEYTKRICVAPEEEVTWLKSTLKALPGDGLILDVGFGRGLVAGSVFWEGRRILGIDIADSMLRYSKARKGVFLCRGTALALPVASESVHGYFAWYSLIHFSIKQLVLALQEAARVLKRDSFIGVALHESMLSASMEDESKGWYYVNNFMGTGRRLPIRLFKTAEIEWAMRITGFRIEKITRRMGDVGKLELPTRRLMIMGKRVC